MNWLRRLPYRSPALTPSALYAGTYGSGVYRSDDRSITRRMVNEGLTYFSVPALVVDPTTPTTLHAGTGDGVLRSADSGVTEQNCIRGVDPRPSVGAPALARQSVRR
ncbi:MAG: hypothetical protein RMJ55_12025 [Roseiflexaceae bacterium]|nr:hypothetical protein [Roseiflexaceae bacterium]